MLTNNCLHNYTIKRFFYSKSIIMDPSNTPTFMRIFTLWANNLRYELDGPTFAKMSKKCNKLMQQGKTQGVLAQRVRDETLEAFNAACQLQPFKVTRNNAFELLDIANEWEVSTLVKFVTEYIKNKGLSRPEDVDPVADLLDHARIKDYGDADIIAVSNIVNDALTDERFLEAPPESIFRVLLKADQRSIDQVKLLDFVISLFNTKPSSAVPLIPLIDFSRLTKEQDEGIFLCPELHEENIGFFLSWALSATRNKADRERLQADSRHFDEVSTMREVIIKAQNTAVANMKAEHDEKMRQLLETAKRQQAEIEDLEDTITREKEEFREIEEQNQKQLDEFEDKINRMKEYSETLAQTEEDMIRILRKEVGDPIDAIHNEYNAQMNEVNDRNEEGLRAIQKSIEDPVRAASEEITDMEQQTSRMNSSLGRAAENLIDAKTSIAVKIVRDHMRYDKFMRVSKENKLNLFNQKNGKGIWGVRQKDAIESNQQINELIKRIDELCPLNECD
ncbi:hypothetical protein TRFO_28134 [Tritrichomonas foetus]|uniref:Uncharacterized protein n=1 Tax=Tritrichomonas foetus TaxID=1144522 RepID=A0A1J4K098_9EUKA|nr:hypothetical protein TRFO_28134 [Tritrichomonas foetus]|eukprot:OHT04370.1 hypothetical protein TRFO_28134 [Tritrichomonas foetus]